MGDGYLVKCKKCGYENRVYLGLGKMFPRVYLKVVDAIRDGDYGEKYRSFFLNHKGAAVDAEKELYVCSGCRHLETDYNLSLYLNRENREPENGYWAKRFYSDEKYDFIESYVHRCPECGKRMHKVRDIEREELKCPDCGESLKTEGRIMWD